MWGVGCGVWVSGTVRRRRLHSARKGPGRKAGIPLESRRNTSGGVPAGGHGLANTGQRHAGRPWGGRTRRGEGRLKTAARPAERSVMLDESEYDPDSAYRLTLPVSGRDDAASDIIIRLDDGADIVIDMGSRTRGRIHAYLTMDQAEDLAAALAEIVRIPADFSGPLNRTDRIRVEQRASKNSQGDGAGHNTGDHDDRNGDAVPKRR